MCSVEDGLRMTGQCAENFFEKSIIHLDCKNYVWFLTNHARLSVFVRGAFDSAKTVSANAASASP